MSQPNSTTSTGWLCITSRCHGTGSEFSFTCCSCTNLGTVRCARFLEGSRRNTSVTESVHSCSIKKVFRKTISNTKDQFSPSAQTMFTGRGSCWNGQFFRQNLESSKWKWSTELMSAGNSEEKVSYITSVTISCTWKFSFFRHLHCYSTSFGCR